MKKKPDLSQCKIEYGGRKYGIDLYGAEDANAAGGLYDLAGKCAEIICGQLDGDVYFSDDLDAARMIIKDEVYRLIKFNMLRSLNRQIQSGSAM